MSLHVYYSSREALIRALDAGRRLLLLRAGRAAHQKQLFRQARLAELQAFLRGDQRLLLPSSDRPCVSILVALYNSAELTFAFLSSLRKVLSVPSEVIIVDNDSTDLTRDLLRRVDGARIELNARNEHFLRAVNQGAKLARGDYVLLVNNDTIVPTGCLEFAIEDLDRDGRVGAVGAKLILPDGTLQEAGSIIWSDGTCVGYGRGQDPNSPAYQFKRNVHYCSGAFLMLRRDLFERLGWFDERFVPAYYEEVDLCMRIRETGLRVAYDPRIAIRHFEFGSSISSQQALDLQARNLKTFREKHTRFLRAKHPTPGSDMVAASNAGEAPRLLFIDDCIPYSHLGAGYPRSRDLILAFRAAGSDVTLYPLIFPQADFETFWREFPPEIEVAAEQGERGLVEFLRRRKGYFDAILVSRPHNMRMFKSVCDRMPDLVEDLPIVYDAEAIFVEREALRRKLLGSPFTPAAYQSELRLEMQLTAGATAILTVSERERILFSRETAAPVVVIGHKVEAKPTSAAFAERANMLFVGALNGSKEMTPNIDSLCWFVHKIMPLIDQLIGVDWKLEVAGRIESADVAALASERVELLGIVPDLAELFNRNRIFVAPTRFCAGLPRKAHDAASAGLPIVATALVASQLGFVSEREILAAESEQGFADACVRLYRDQDLWERLREAALAKIDVDCSPEKFLEGVKTVLNAVSASSRKRSNAPTA